ncbi:MAG: hypothetical protein DRP56_09340 [Planctomycetota bacterium]|nr:MAG: hypothetical protein DRP56_09340 [Planctomycetota bacterium]
MAKVAMKQVPLRLPVHMVEELDEIREMRKDPSSRNMQIAAIIQTYLRPGILSQGRVQKEGGGYCQNCNTTGDVWYTLELFPNRLEIQGPFCEGCLARMNLELGALAHLEKSLEDTPPATV